MPQAIKAQFRILELSGWLINNATIEWISPASTHSPVAKIPQQIND